MLGLDSQLGNYWYAVSTRSRHEKVGASLLERIGISTFLPLLSEKHRWSDRHKVVTVPLFPSYIFVQIPPDNEFFVRILRTPGIVSFVGSRGLPISIPAKEINDIRTVLSQKADCCLHSFLEFGQRVRIVGGALDQVEGTLVGRGPESKLVVSIELIQRSIAVSLYDFRVEPVSQFSATRPLAS
jgi:transcription antitermination factor NusG